MKASTEEEKTKAVNMVKNGMTYSEVARKIDVSYEAVRHWCIKADVHTSFTHTKKTDDEIISAIKEAKVITQAELSQLLNYQSMNNRLRVMIMKDKIKSTIIPPPSSAARIRGPLRGYQNKRLYYIKKEDVNEWLKEKLPNNMPPGMRRAVSHKLNIAGIDISKPYSSSRYKSVALNKDTCERLKQVAERKKMTLRFLVEDIVEEWLNSNQSTIIH